MSYWNQNSTGSSQLDELLSKEDVSLREVLDEAEVIQELKSQNKKLIDYLSRPDVLRELIAMTTSEPAEDDAEALRYKYPSIACELLTSELPQIIQALAYEQTLLAELYAFLEADSPLNPLLASFFSRIMGVLISKTNENNWFSYQVTCLQVLEFIKSRGNCVALLLRHIGTSAIMDLILKMYTKIEGPEMRDHFLRWLDEGEFLEQLVAQLNPESSADVRSNVCQLLCDLILANRDNINKTTDKPEQDCIADKIESEAFVKKLLEQMLNEPRCEGSIVGGISVLLTLLGNGKRDEYPFASWNATPSPQASAVTDKTVAAIIPHLSQVLDILRNPPPKPIVRTTVGTLDPPLGATRVEVVRLLAALVATGHEDLMEELQRQDLLNVLLDLFFQYPWNNFLHAQVEATLVAAFQSVPLVTHVLTQCRLLLRILEAWQDNDAQEKDKKPRRGYMGHVIRISNHVAEKTGMAPLDAVLADAVDADLLAQWGDFVATALAKVNGDQSSGMGYIQKKQEEIDNAQFYQELNRKYYQLQSLAPSFADNFCQEETGNNDDNSVGGVTLKPGFLDADSESTLAKQAEMFSQVCAQKMQALDEDSDLWSSMMHSSAEDRDARAWNDEGSSDEEPGGEQDEDHDEWPETGSAVPGTEQNNPWSADVLSASSPPDQGWANFESSPFLANFGFDLSSTIATSEPGDVERVPFDLTPTETQQFLPGDAPPTDWPVTPPPSETPPEWPVTPPPTDAPPDWPETPQPTEAPPSDWRVSPPSETPPSDVENPLTDNEETSASLRDGSPPRESSPLSDVDSLDGAKPALDDKSAVTSQSSPDESQEDTSLEKLSTQVDSQVEKADTAQVVERGTVEIVAVSDIMSQYEELKLGPCSSGSVGADTSQSSNEDSVIAAFPLKTVIKQTETLGTLGGPALPSNIPSVSDSMEVAAQMAELLAEVSISSSEVPDSEVALVNVSDSRTWSAIDEVTNGPGAAGDVPAEGSSDAAPPCVQTLATSRNETPKQGSTADNDELNENADIVPKVTSKIAVKEEDVASPATATTTIDPVTAI